MKSQALFTYENFLLSGNTLLSIDCSLRAAKLISSLVLTHSSLSLSVHISKILSESIFDVIANQNSGSVGVLWVSNFGMERHICFSLLLI